MDVSHRMGEGETRKRKILFRYLKMKAKNIIDELNNNFYRFYTKNEKFLRAVRARTVHHVRNARTRFTDSANTAVDVKGR